MVCTSNIFGINMVQAVININENANRVLNIVKAKYGLNDKSQAINVVVQIYEEECMEPELRPEYIAELTRIEKGNFTHYKNMDELRKSFENP